MSQFFTNNYQELIESEPYGKQLESIIDIFLPLVLELPELRNNSDMLQETIKAVSKDGVADVATAADIFIQEKLKQAVLAKHPDWQFWGEEGSDNTSTYDESKSFLFITDPIEGTNNFKAGNDDDWGSVVALVDSKSKKPVIGIVAHPTAFKLYIGVKKSGAYVAEYDEHGKITSLEPMPKKPEKPEFTYNNSPHFDSSLTLQVEKFYKLGSLNRHDSSANPLGKSRKTVSLPSEGLESVFVDLESGALEAARNRGTIYFKTSNEMAAVFVIIEELNGKITDGNAKEWTLGINSLISARDENDYDYLLSIYRKVTN